MLTLSVKTAITRAPQSKDTLSKNSTPTIANPRTKPLRNPPSHKATAGRLLRTTRRKTKKTHMKIKTNKSSSAFTLIELLVVIAIIAILAAFAVPALTSALAKGQMTGTMNNARQMYIAQFQMSNDGAATGDATSAWPGDLPTVPADLQTY